MGTRSVVAVRDEKDGFRGRYVHWDGYPDGVGAAVFLAVQRDGYDTAVKTLTQDYYGWSSVDGNEKQQLGVGYDDGRFVAVPGYGIAYTVEQNQSSPDDWQTQDTVEDGRSWVEWVHIIEEDGSVLSYPNRDERAKSPYAVRYNADGTVSRPNGLPPEDEEE